MDELVNLKPGDVVRLERNIREDLVLEVAGREKYHIRPCLVNRKKGGVVSQVIAPPEDMF
jgi:flagellar motor switch protein FliM